MSQTNKVTKQQKILAMEEEIRLRMETLIPKMQEMVGDYNIAGDRSPYRNVLNVAVDPSSDVEITKNFILYQLGRDRNSPWRKTGTENKKFGLALVEVIAGLDSDAKKVVEAMKEDLNTESGKNWLQQVHRRLMQLYLGHLVRYQVYLTFIDGERNRPQRRTPNVR